MPRRILRLSSREAGGRTCRQRSLRTEGFIAAPQHDGCSRRSLWVLSGSCSKCSEAARALRSGTRFAAACRSVRSADFVRKTADLYSEAVLRSIHEKGSFRTAKAWLLL